MFKGRSCDTFLSLRDKKEKQEGSVLAQRYVNGLLRKAPVYKGFGTFLKIGRFGGIMKKTRGPNKTKEFFMKNGHRI